MKITVERVMPAPVEQTFEAYGDFRNAGERIQGIDKIEVLTEGPTGVGTRFRETRTIMGKQAVETMEITAYEQNKMMTIEAFSCGCQYISHFHFEPRGAETLVRMEFGGYPKTLLARLMTPMAWIMGRMMKKLLLKDMDDMATYLGGGRSADTVGSPA